jgi:hypothetical protein
MTIDRLRVGFAAVWDDPPETTWSYTPWSLLQALEHRPELDVVDLGPSLSKGARTGLKVAAGRRVDGATVSLWRSSWLTDRYLAGALGRAVEEHQPDMVLQVLDIAPAEVPYVLYQDMSWRLLQRLAEDTPVADLGHPGVSRRRLERRAQRERDLHDGAAGVAVMSAWVRDFLVKECDVPRDRVAVVRPGCNVAVAPSVRELEWRLDRPHREVLFVGRDFGRKAGDVVVDAIVRLRADGEDVRLTVIGPETWPLPEPVPDGVTFLGRVPRARVREMLSRSDLFVMPSRFEAYGIALAEALSAGVPCVGRDAFAMPEIIQPGVNGALVEDLDPGELAGAIAATLADDRIFEAAAREAAGVRAFYSWERAARDMAGFLRSRQAASSRRDGSEGDDSEGLVA